MSNTTKTASKSTISKKEVRHQIALKLETALAEFKNGLGEKKFKSKIKKASKLFSDHYASTAPSKKSVTKKKAAPKKKSAPSASSKGASAPSKTASAPSKGASAPSKAASAKGALKKASTPRKKAASSHT
jgi:hypothetical protein